MSAAKDEADDGPLELNNEGNSGGEKTLRDDENGQAQEEKPLTATLSEPNGVEEGEDFGSLQASSPVPERPSSADESLSIPDDTPSLQVRLRHAQSRPYSDRLRAL